MPEKIMITSDSTTDLSDALRERYGIELMRLGITLGDQTYTDGIDIDPEMIYSNYKENKTLPKTSATNPADAIRFFKQFADQGFSVVHFTISSDMSSTYQNCVVAAQEFENVYVVDTRNLSTGGGWCSPPASCASRARAPKRLPKLARPWHPGWTPRL